MNAAIKKIRALGLCSGGLDSILAGVVLRRQGIDVLWVSFETPFFSADKAKKASEMTGIPLITKDITDRYMPMLKNPPCGYGQHMNPCMDCHALMFAIAGEMMAETGCDFLFSGEVLGQRPMSQVKSSLRYVEKNSGFDGKILRPLSARMLPETDMEAAGLVDREQLYALTGRSRKPQMAMAKEFGITDYPAPAGGCLLTDKAIAIRLRDLFAHQEAYSRQELELLKYGRHFRLDERVKIVVGRNKADNEGILYHYRPDTDVLVKLHRIPGPVIIVSGGGDTVHIEKAAGICAGYSKAAADPVAEVCVRQPEGDAVIRVAAIQPSAIRHLMIA